MYYSDTLAETIMRRYPDPDQYPYRSWCYAQGFMLWDSSGFMSGRRSRNIMIMF